MKKYNFYLAGPFFFYKQIIQQDTIEAMMEKYEKDFFSPRKHAGQLGPESTKQEMLEVFQNDLNGIDNCDMLLANISYKDTGTCVEIGYALAKGIPVILFWDKDNHEGMKINLMLAMACGGKVIQSYTELAQFLKDGSLPDNHFTFDVE